MRKKEADPPPRFIISKDGRKMRCRVCGYTFVDVPVEQRAKVEYDHLWSYGKDRCHFPKAS